MLKKVYSAALMPVVLVLGASSIANAGAYFGSSEQTSVQEQLYKPSDEQETVADRLYMGGEKSFALSAAVLTTPAQADWYKGGYWLGVDHVDPSITRVRFPTWTTANGQDDLVWVEGENKGNGLWIAKIELNRHNWEVGEYVTHAYGTDGTGKETFLSGGGTQVVFGNDRKGYAYAPFGYVDATNGSFDLYAANMDGGTARVRFLTWTALNGQDDYEWIEGTYLGAGVWKAKVDLTRHRFERGSYITHVYKYDAAGQGQMVDWTTSEVRPPTTVPRLNAVPIVDLKTGSYDVYAYNVSSTAVNVMFPTWSDVNGQDDFEHIAGTNLGNGTWKATVSLGKHKNDLGTYHTQVYQYDSNGVETFFKGVAVQVVSNRTRVQYFYDANGRLDHIVTPDGKTLHYLYDANGNLIRRNYLK